MIDLDTQPGRVVTVVDRHDSGTFHSRTFFFCVQQDADMGLVPTPWTRLAVACRLNGEMKVRILEGRSSGA